MPLPDRPDPDDIVASTWGQWVHDTVAKLSMYRFDGSTDTGGNVALPASAWHPGLTAIAGVMVSASSPAGYCWPVMYESGGTLTVHVNKSPDGNTWSPLITSAVSIMVWSWGAPALGLLDVPETRPADGPELEHHDAA